MIATDPVCGMQVDERNAAGKSEYGGKIYSFCSAGCRAAFDQHPEHYLLRREGGAAGRGPRGRAGNSDRREGGYSPDVIRVREGVLLRLLFDRQESSDCTARVAFPDFGISKALPAFRKTVVEFVPDKAGEFGFACGMNMVHGTLVVERVTVAYNPERVSPGELKEAIVSTG